MAHFIHSILSSNSAITADGDEVIDLPVNPLSVILIHISPLNETSTIGDYTLLEGLLSALDNIRVTHQGAAIFDANGFDAVALATLYRGQKIWQSNAVETDNIRRSLVVPITFGRTAYNQQECVPKTTKGELQMNLTWDIADTGFDGLRRSIETIELPNASPSHFEKVTTLAQSFAATGQNEVDLPIGNILRAILAFGTTPYSGAVPAPTLGELQLLVNNHQTHYSASDFEVMRSIMGLMGITFPPDGRHIASLNAAGVAREDTLEPQIGASLDDNYVLMHLDPTGDDTFSIPTDGASRVLIRVDAEAADATRWLPIEKVVASRLQG